MRLLSQLLFSSFILLAEDKVDPAFHADVLTLIELEGVHEQMQTSIPDFVERGRQVLVQKCAGCTPEFTEEWVKRMKIRMNADVLTGVVVRTYEKDLTDADVKQLIPVVKAKKAGETPSIPDDLKQRIAATFPAMQSEIVAECTRIGTRIGSEVGSEIEKEHPEWVRHTSPAPAK